jgi:hypothetical protein
MRLALLVFMIALLAKDIHDHVEEKPPALNVTVQAPPAPIIQIVQSVPKGSFQREPPKVATQIGNGNSANPGTATGPVHVEPCGVFQNGGANNAASTNCGPPEPKIEHFEIVPAIPSNAGDGKPLTAFRFTLSAPLTDQKFIAICSRPCTAKNAVASPHPSMVLSSDFGTGQLPGSPEAVAWMINIPMHVDQFWIFTVESNDQLPVSIDRFAIAKFPVKPQ